MKKSLLSLLLIATLTAETFAEFKANEAKAFDAEKKAIEAEFKNYKATIAAEFKQYQKELGVIWKEPKISTKSEWVEYSKDKKSRKIVDFENETITIDVVAKNQKEANSKIAKELIGAVTSDTTTAYKNDVLAQRIDKKFKRSIKSKVNSMPILAPVIFKKPPSVKEQVQYAKKSYQK